MTQSFGFAGGDPDREQNPLANLGEALQSFGRMLAGGGGAAALTPASLRQSASVHMPSHRIVEPKVVAATRAAGELADLWLDEHTALPSSGRALSAWSPQEWLESTAAGWVTLAGPVIAGTARASTAAFSGQESDTDPASGTVGPFGLPMGAVPAQLLAFAEQMTLAMLQQQLGATVAQLSGQVMSLSESPFGLTRDIAAVLPAEIEAFADALELPKDHALLWNALRESAFQRLAAHAPWLNRVLADAMAIHSANLTINTDGLADAVSGFDPTNPASLQSLAESGLLEPQPNATGIAAAARVATLYSLIEGWIDAVTRDAAGERLSSFAALTEAYQRRRATENPAQTALAGLLGLDLSAKRIRSAAALWTHIGSKYGLKVRDNLWSHPDALPTPTDLDDPTDFLASLNEPAVES